MENYNYNYNKYTDNYDLLTNSNFDMPQNYFNNKISLREENKKAKQTKNKDSLKQYCINPDFLAIKNEDGTMKELVEICSQKYPENKKKVTARILEQSIKIDVKNIMINNAISI